YSDGSTISSATCSVCPAGTYLEDEATSAALHDSVEDCTGFCPAGTYLEDEASSAALHDSVEDCTGFCPAGTYLEDEATSAALHNSVEDCDVCPAGTYLEDEASSAALHNSVEDCTGFCPAGTYLEDEATSAALHDSVEDCTGFCPAGTYLSDEATSAALHDSVEDCTGFCPAGTYLEDEATSAALHDSVEDCNGFCPAGTYLSDEATSAALHDSVEDCTGFCPAGTYLEDEATSAALHDSVEDCTGFCPAGTYLEDEATSAALHNSVEDCTGFCPAGTYLSDEATSGALHDSVEDCSVCPAGTYLCPGASDRIACPPGSYQSEAKQTKYAFVAIVGVVAAVIFTCIVSQFESVLNVRFPKAFEEFGRLVSKFVNLDALNLTKVGCLVQTNFYHKLVLSTMGPLCVSAVIGLGALVMKKRAKDHEHKQAAINGAVSLFLGLTYLVFSSVSTTIFDTFNCKTFGDDEREYMMSDQSVDCGSPDHIWYQTYAGVMMFVYPVGIPMMYGVLLWRAREQLREDGREEVEKLHKIAFLWQDYEQEMWWFEVFDCVRRLSLTGLLVFVFKGQASQIVVAMAAMDRTRARTETVAFEIEMRENPLRIEAGATDAGEDGGKKGGGERGVGDARLKTMESFRANPAAKGAQK
ncbi:hypothetical protein TeGR_g6250, partial [Tetraparma gracilis]